MSPRWWICAFILVGAGLRLWDLGGKSLWADELITVYISKNTVRIIPYCQESNTPPLRYYLSHCLGKIEPVETFVRAPSALFGILSLPLLFSLARRLYDTRTGLVAMAFLTFSPWHVLHSQDARMYALFLFLALLSIHLAFWGLEKQRIACWALLGLTMAVASYVTYFALWTSFILIVFLCLVIAARVFRRERHGAPGPGRLVLGVAVSILVAVVLYIPWLGSLGSVLEQYGLPFFSKPAREASAAAAAQAEDAPAEKAGLSPAQRRRLRKAKDLNPVLTRYGADYVFDFIKKLGCQNATAAAVLFALFIVGLTTTFRENPKFALLSILWITIPLIIVLTTPIKHFMPHRYLFFYLGVYLILAALGLVRLASLVSMGVSRLTTASHGEAKEESPRRKWLNAGVVAAVVVIVGAFCIDDVTYYRREKQDWRGAMDYLGVRLRDGDWLVTGQAWSDLGAHCYRSDTKRVRVINKCYDLGMLSQVFEAAPSLWYINWGPLPEPAQKVVDEYLVLRRSFPGMFGEITVYEKKRI